MKVRAHGEALKALNAAKRHRSKLEAARRDILAERCPKGRPLYGYGFARNVTTLCLRVGIEVDRLGQIHRAGLKRKGK